MTYQAIKESIPVIGAPVARRYSEVLHLRIGASARPAVAKLNPVLTAETRAHAINQVLQAQFVAEDRRLHRWR